jgi:hypothetical protein
MGNYQSKIRKNLGRVTLSAIALMSSAVAAAPAMAAEWSLPWQAGVNATISRGTASHNAHNDSWNKQFNAVDFANIRAGTPVLAPVDGSRIKAVCQARGGDNHNAIWFSSPDGDYTLMHVKASGLRTGQVFNRGQQIGVVAADTPKDKNCAVSTGVHVHINFPNRNLVVDGYRVANMTGGTFTSRNGQPTPPPQPQPQPQPPNNNGVNVVNFSAVTHGDGVNIRSAPSTSASIAGRLGGNVRVNFDGWVHSETVRDAWTGNPDRRWYRIAGTNQWVASAVVNGNAPGSQP